MDEPEFAAGAVEVAGEAELATPDVTDVWEAAPSDDVGFDAEIPEADVAGRTCLAADCGP